VPWSGSRHRSRRPNGRAGRGRRRQAAPTHRERHRPSPHRARSRCRPRAWLVVNDTHYPGLGARRWMAARRTFIPANGFVRAVRRSTAGDHVVTMTYQPLWWWPSPDRVGRRALGAVALILWSAATGDARRDARRVSGRRAGHPRGVSAGWRDRHDVRLVTPVLAGAAAGGAPARGTAARAPMRRNRGRSTSTGAGARPTSTAPGGGASGSDERAACPSPSWRSRSSSPGWPGRRVAAVRARCRRRATVTRRDFAILLHGRAPLSRRDPRSTTRGWTTSRGGQREPCSRCGGGPPRHACTPTRATCTSTPSPIRHSPCCPSCRSRRSRGVHAVEAWLALSVVLLLVRVRLDLARAGPPRRGRPTLTTAAVFLTCETARELARPRPDQSGSCWCCSRCSSGRSASGRAGAPAGVALGVATALRVASRPLHRLARVGRGKVGGHSRPPA